MAEEKELIKKRGSYKGRLTVFASYLNTLEDSSLTSSEASELQLRIGKIELLYERYDEVQLKLECMAESIDSQINERTDFENQYYIQLARAQQILNSFSLRKSESEIDKSSQHNSAHKLVKLPTISLAKFGGDFNDWMGWHDSFTSLIHSNDNLDDINKFHYLKLSLQGSAAVVIQSIGFSASNYDVAWQLLCERFNNKRLLINNHVSALFNIEPITKESSMCLKRIIDDLNKNLRSLQSLGEPTEHWDTLLIYMVTQKLDSKTLREWEEFKGQLKKHKHITLKGFNKFLRSRADLIETLESSRKVTHNNQTHSIKGQSKLKTMVSLDELNAPSSSKPCPKCQGDHTLSKCSQFLALTNSGRLQLLSNYKICFNCLQPGHFSNRCKKNGCKICRRRHSTLVHVEEYKAKPSFNTRSRSEDDKNCASIPFASTSSANVTLTTNITTSSSNKQASVLLSTALVKLYDVNNVEHIARALLDTGSTSCLMSEKMFNRLNLSIVQVDKIIMGVGNVTSQVGKMCRVSMKSLSEKYSTDLQCFILPTITDNVPCRPVNLSHLSIPSDICLADPNFHTPDSIDIIIGAGVFWDLLGSQQIKLGDGQPILQETRLGWLVSGPISGDYNMDLCGHITCNFIKADPINNIVESDEIPRQFSKFWQIEEVCPQSVYTPEEKLCEEHFTNNTTRLEDGRFCVKLPVKDHSDGLGDSLKRAKHCLLSLERRLKGQSGFSKMYHDFMSEYEALGHMTEYQQDNSELIPYFIPHHGVLSENSSTTKLRVVFNASSPTGSGTSLNQTLMVGPSVQDDLLSILIRFRQHKYVLAADVEKMYRQIAVHPSDRHLQQILWRDDPLSPVRVFQLNTVTYGVSCSSFLATRTLKQIGLECKDEKISEIIIHDFYVDDLLTGGDQLEEVKESRHKITAALNAACMPLRKWKSNEPQLISDSPQASIDLNIGDTSSSKTLGLGWQTSVDELHFPVGTLDSKGKTKREMLSTIAQIFDPLGLLAPCVIQMKMLLQRLWLDKLSWDDQLSPEIANKWEKITLSLPVLISLRVPRHVLCDAYEQLELHVFTDSSELAYGACVYVRSVNNESEVLVRLLMAKSRVAPIKPTTIPRLELCGALVGARLYEKVVNSLRAKVTGTIFWTDSTIVLGWLKMHPSKLQPFVRNRVAEILDKTGNCTWRHVPTDVNPADLISRGVNAEALQSLVLWWLGPSYLRDEKSDWPINPVATVSLPETRPEVSLHVVVDKPGLINFDRFSNFLRLKRAIAYMMRFINACKRQPVGTGPLSNNELQSALNIIITNSQRESFPEYKMLIDKQNLPAKSTLLKFNVFLDDQKIMRVGGRLGNSPYDYDKKYPILLQSTHRLTKLLFNFEHLKLMHAGPQLLLASIRERYWPLGGRNLAKATYHRCVRCRRMKGQIIAPKMGNLPSSRFVPGYPFQSVGVDYAGPLLSASRQGRGCRLVKVYVAVFVCFTSKSIHLELVGDLTSNNFLLALRRFISRRGKPHDIYSDNGTSFVGASNDIAKFLKTNCDSLAENVANEEITFHLFRRIVLILVAFGKRV